MCLTLLKCILMLICCLLITCVLVYRGGACIMITRVCLSTNWTSHERVDGRFSNLVDIGKGWPSRSGSILVLIWFQMWIHDALFHLRSAGNQVCQPILEHQIRLCAPSSVISRPTSPVSAVVYAAADWWLSTVRPAPWWLSSEFGAVYKYSDSLTHSLTRLTSKIGHFLIDGWIFCSCL